MPAVNDGRPPDFQFILKIASRCNLNCSYCYVYNKGDDSWQTRPVFMPSEIFTTSLRRIRSHCVASGQDAVRITFHGGEPCLVGPARFDHWCQEAYDTLADVCRVELSLQTNGTLLDEDWIGVLRRHQVSVGLSLDGPRLLHDRSRVDARGRGSYREAVKGLGLLRDGGLAHQVLTVIQPGADGLEVHRHLVALGARRINYLFPDFTHDSVGPVRAAHGLTPCADYLLPILDDWWTNGTLDVRIAIFWNMARVILGGSSQLDLFGPGAYQYVFIESDGAIEGLDVLKICGQGLAETALHVRDHEFVDIAARNPLHQQVMFEGLPRPGACDRCPERESCGGGYLPHRFGTTGGFDHATIWCADMLKLFGRLRTLLNVSTDDTAHRRAVLQKESRL